MKNIGCHIPFSYANAQISIHLQMDTFIVIPEVIGFVGFVSVSFVDLTREMRSEKNDNFSCRASYAAL